MKDNIISNTAKTKTIYATIRMAGTEYFSHSYVEYDRYENWQANKNKQRAL